MNIVVIGKSGQLAIDLRDACVHRRAFNVTFLGRNDINFLSFSDTESVLRTCAPEGIINAAAFTAVDQAESHYEEAAFVNETIPERLALICQRMNIPLVHVSTDQVFDGTKKGMYNEEDAPNPLNVYGLTKWNGEQRVKDCSENSLIVRTTWIYGPSGRNFIHLCLNAAKRQSDFSVVCDQLGKPTFGPTLAEELVRLLVLMISDAKRAPRGTLHLAGCNAISRYEQAQEILSCAARFGFPNFNCIPITTAAYGAIARRPLNAVLDTDKAEKTFGVSFREFSLELDSVMRRIVNEGIFN